MPIKFQDPPSDRRKHPEYTEIFAELRKRPGEWALVHEAHTHTHPAVQVKHGRYIGCEPGEFETRTVVHGKRPNATFDIYMRYVGNEPR